MKRYSLKLLALCLSFCLLFMLSSCRKGQDDSSSNTSSETASDTLPPDVPTFSDDYERLLNEVKGSTVKILTFKDLNHSYSIYSLPVENMKNDIGITLEEKITTATSYAHLLASYKASGNMPDVICVDSKQKNSFETLYYAAPINKVSTLPLDHKRFEKNTIHKTEINGNVYFLSNMSQSHVLTTSYFLGYDIYALQSYGITTPEEYMAENNWTLDSLLNIMTELKANGHDRIAFFEEEIFLAAYGGSVFKFNTTTSRFERNNSDTTQIIHEWLYNANKQGLSIAGKDKYNLGSRGYAIFCADTDDLLDTNDNSRLTSKHAFAPFPSIDGTEDALVPTTFKAYAIGKGAPNTNAAGYAISYLLDASKYGSVPKSISNESLDFYYKIGKTSFENRFILTDGICSSLPNTISSIYTLRSETYGSKIFNNTIDKEKAKEILDTVNKCIEYSIKKDKE